MSQNSKIEWTATTWNPVTGCTKLSPGCQHCYAERMAKRLKAMGQPNYQNGFTVTCHPDMLLTPLEWHKPRLVFVNSMSDLFHADVPDSFIQQVFTTMSQAGQHTFQVLTKRAERLAAMAPHLPWPENVWMGVTVENAACAHRLSCLRLVTAAVRFLSLEPLLGLLRALILMVSTGSSWEASQDQGAKPMELHGCVIFGTSVLRPASPSSSSNGRVSTPRDLAANWTGEHGRRCQRLKTSNHNKN